MARQRAREQEQAQEIELARQKAREHEQIHEMELARQQAREQQQAQETELARQKARERELTRETVPANTKEKDRSLALEKAREAARDQENTQTDDQARLKAPDHPTHRGEAPTDRRPNPAVPGAGATPTGPPAFARPEADAMRRPPSQSADAQPSPTPEQVLPAAGATPTQDAASNGETDRANSRHREALPAALEPSPQAGALLGAHAQPLRTPVAGAGRHTVARIILWFDPSPALIDALGLGEASEDERDDEDDGGRGDHGGHGGHGDHGGQGGQGGHGGRGDHGDRDDHGDHDGRGSYGGRGNQGGQAGRGGRGGHGGRGDRTPGGAHHDGDGRDEARRGGWPDREHTRDHGRRRGVDWVLRNLFWPRRRGRHHTHDYDADTYDADTYDTYEASSAALYEAEDDPAAPAPLPLPSAPWPPADPKPRTPPQPPAAPVQQTHLGLSLGLWAWNPVDIKADEGWGDYRSREHYSQTLVPQVGVSLQADLPDVRLRVAWQPGVGGTGKHTGATSLDAMAAINVAGPSRLSLGMNYMNFGHGPMKVTSPDPGGPVFEAEGESTVLAVESRFEVVAPLYVFGRYAHSSLPRAVYRAREQDGETRRLHITDGLTQVDSDTFLLGFGFANRGPLDSVAVGWLLDFRFGGGVGGYALRNLRDDAALGDGTQAVLQGDLVLGYRHPLMEDVSVGVRNATRLLAPIGLGLPDRIAGNLNERGVDPAGYTLKFGQLDFINQFMVDLILTF